jgi:4-hydroxy-2-oxoheptanedioate aldolase
MKENIIKKKIAEKQPVFGVISNVLDPTVAEILGFAGHDFFMIDGEHSQVSTSDIINIIRACEISGTTPLARVRSNDAKLILQYLDAGVMGIMMPGIQTAKEIEHLVKAVKYPPVGERGLGPVRAADYLLGKMNQLTYVNFANANTLVLPQVEDMEAVKNLPKMVKVAGVDGFIIGPRDLAMSMGFYDSPAHDEVKKVIDQIFEIVLNAGLMVGTVAGNAEQAKALIDKGAGFVMNSVAGLLSSASAAFLKK